MSDTNVHRVVGNLLVGTSHFFVDTTTNQVGINTSSPSASLDVATGDVKVGSGITLANNGTITATGGFSGDGSGLSGVNSDSGSWVNGSSSNVHLATSTDNVGIGVLDAGYKLDVDGDINISLGSTLRVNGTPAVFSNWTVHTNASDIYRSSGNVGIGTASPAKPLHIEHYGSAIGDFEGIRIANHATNLHATSRPAYEIVVSDIDAGTGLGKGKFSIGYRGNTTASRIDRLVIDNSGNVGIGGVTVPDVKLHVGGGNIRVDGTGERIIENRNDISDYGTLTLTSGYRGGSQRPKIQIHGYKGQGNVNGDNMITFNTNGSERMKINQSGQVGIGKDPTTNLDVNGIIKVSDRIMFSGYSISQGPRVIHVDDSRGGCPPSQAANSNIMQSTFSLARTAYVYASVTTILVHSSRADSHIYFNGSHMQSHLTASDNTSWNPVNITAGGSLGAGTHTISFRCSTANVVGCQGNWGGLQILIFET